MKDLRVVDGIAILVVMLTLSMEGAIMFGHKPDIDAVLLGRILGTLDAALLMVLSFYYGASATSQRGQRAADNPAPPAPSQPDTKGPV
jgi:hypothetical protein